MFFWAAGGVSACKTIKQNYIENISVKKWKNNTKLGPCLETSCATIFQPRIPAHLMHFAYCMNLISRIPVKYNAPPYLRELAFTSIIGWFFLVEQVGFPLQTGSWGVPVLCWQCQATGPAAGWLHHQAACHEKVWHHKSICFWWLSLFLMVLGCSL